MIWVALLACAMGLFTILRVIHLPPPITVYREGRVDKYSWGELIASVIVNLVALHIALTTKAGPWKPNDIGYILRRYARTGGFIIGIGGWFGTVHLLAILLGYARP
jgi:hypothetical protein